MDDVPSENHPVYLEQVDCPLCDTAGSVADTLEISRPVLRLNSGFCQLPSLNYSLCGRDGLIYMSRRPSRKTLAWYYRNSPQISPSCSGEVSSVNRERIEWLRELSPLAEGDCVVDVGTNDGNFLHALDQAGYEAVGIEPSEQAVKRLNNFYESVEVHSGSVDESIDILEQINPRLLSMIHLFEHLPEPIRLLEKIKEVTDSLLYLEVPNGAATLYPRITREHGHLFYYDLNSLESVLATAGYSLRRRFVSPDKRILRVIAEPVLQGQERKLTPPSDERIQLWKSTREKAREAEKRIRRKTESWSRLAQNGDHSVGLYGAGTDSYRLLRRASGLRENVEVVFDRTEHFQGQRLLGVPIVAPTDDVISELDYLLITPLGSEKAIANSLPASVKEHLTVHTL